LIAFTTRIYDHAVFSVVHDGTYIKNSAQRQHEYKNVYHLHCLSALHYMGQTSEG